MNRRSMLRRGVLLGVLGLAGCAGGDGDDGSGESTTTTTEATTTTATTTTATTTEPTTTEPPTESTTTTTTTGGDSGTPDDSDGGGGGSTTTTTEAEVPSNVEVTVGDGANRFAPETFTLQAGGTVTWTWMSSGHNVVPDSQPDGAEWTGVSELRNAGATDEHTFDVPGDYEYHCDPHEQFGMVGSFTVVE